MGLVQQGWVGQSRGKMPPTFLLAAVGAASCRDRSSIAGPIAAGSRSHAALRFKSVPLFLLTLGDSLVSFRFEKRYDR